MRRGFKAEAERKADELRTAIGQTLVEPADLKAVARHIGAEVRCADTLIDTARLVELERTQPGAFSACTLTLGTRRVVVYSPLASQARQASDIAHELAHLVLDHPVGTVQQVGAFTFFTCDPDEEQEANWLAGCLLLPRAALVNAARRGRNARQIAQDYSVSEIMATFRLRATGVLRQIASST